jgi:hypothetical protein
MIVQGGIDVMVSADRVPVTVVFTEGQPEQFEMVVGERDRFLQAFVAYINAGSNAPYRAGVFEIWNGHQDLKAAFDYSLIRYIR